MSEILTRPLSLWSVIVDGAWLLIPLAVIFIAVVWVFIARCVALRKARRGSADIMHRIRECVMENDLDNAVKICKSLPTPLARVLERGVKRIGSPIREINAAMDNAGNIETDRLGKGLTFLSLASGGAPLIGFIGTVVGMMEAFNAMATAAVAPGVGPLASGICQALVTTVGGLAVGLCALAAHNILAGMINRHTTFLNSNILEFLDFLTEPV